MKLRDSRVFTCKKRKMTQHLALFRKLLARHMSGDETDGPVKRTPPRFRILETRWQSRELKAFLRALDAMYREDCLDVGV